MVKEKLIQFLDDYDRTDAEQHLVALMRSKNGLTPDDVVTDAKKKTSPLHDKFTWDDSEAGHKWRLREAQMLIQNLKIKIVDTREETETVIRMAVSVFMPSGDQKYVTVERAVSDDDMRVQMLETAKRDMNAFRRKYAILSELSAVFAALDQVNK
jgi:hypothetical protein